MCKVTVFRKIAKYHFVIRMTFDGSLPQIVANLGIP